MKQDKQPVLASLLVAEDEETEIMLMQMAMKRARLNYPVIFARDGQETIDYLTSLIGSPNEIEGRLPRLIILDLKMPRLTGFDVLAWLSTQTQLRNIPAVVLSSSSYPDDIRRATELGAREFFIKPHTLTELIGLLRTATQRWIGQPSEASVE